MTHAALPVRPRPRGFAALFVAAAGCTGGVSDLPDLDIPDEGRAVKVTRARALASVPGQRFAGELRSSDRSEVAFRVEGTIRSLSAELGDRVQAGQTLGQLDAAPYRARATQAEGRLADARAQRLRAQQEADRIESLFDADAATERQLERARQRLDSARGLFEARREASRLARMNLGYASMRAPFDAFVSAQLAEVGETVKVGQPVFLLSAGDGLEVRTQVPETLVHRIEPGDEVEVELTRLDEALGGRVREVARAPGPRSVLYTVVASLEAPPPEARPGMSATVRFPSAGRGQQTVVPPAAVIAERDGGFSVVVLTPPDEDGTNGRPRFVAERRRVTLGPATGSGVVVRSGLEAGARVAAAGAGTIEDGEEVRAAVGMARVPPLRPNVEGAGRAR